MRIIVQRCDKAEVRVEGNVVGKINYGMMLLVSFTYGDTEKEIDYVIEHMPAIMDKLTSISPFQDELAVLRSRKGV